MERRLLFAFFQRPSIDEHKKTRAQALVFWLLMGDILSPRDKIFFFLFDSLDIVLMSKNDQGS